MGTKETMIHKYGGEEQYKEEMRKRGRTGGLSYKYGFASMEIGDSFDVAEADYFRVANAARGFGLRNNMKFQLRTTAKITKLVRIK